ncbi:hypothetical protein BN1007_70567 [Klebsiella variicola]|nr:hypothetical protein BN1007_70567 [Klebsiella variicola]
MLGLQWIVVVLIIRISLQGSKDYSLKLAKHGYVVPTMMHLSSKAVWQSSAVRSPTSTVCL